MFYSKTLTIIFVAATFLVVWSFATMGRLRLCEVRKVDYIVRNNATSHSLKRLTLKFRTTSPDIFFLRHAKKESSEFVLAGIIHGVMKFIRRCSNGHIIVIAPAPERLDDGEEHTVGFTKQEGHNGAELVMQIDGMMSVLRDPDLSCEVTTINNRSGDQEDYEALYQDILGEHIVNDGCVHYMDINVPYWVHDPPLPNGANLSYVKD